jgi:FkbM family methyltransferase
LDLWFNRDARFTNLAVSLGWLHEPFVVVDVGVQGGEHPRWHLLRDHLVVHGFDAIQEAIDDLAKGGLPNHHYHCIALGSSDGEAELFFNPQDPCSSSIYQPGAGRAGQQSATLRRIPMRRLDTLLGEGIIPAADFLKVDVEGFEKDVFLGARTLLGAGMLAVETESSFDISPEYLKPHVFTLQDILLEHGLLVFDLNLNRIPRESFQRALLSAGLQPIMDQASIGSVSTLNVLFCRDLVAESAHSENYVHVPPAPSLDQKIKMLIICELHGLNDVAVDIVECNRETLQARFDPDRAIALLANPYCRGAMSARYRNDFGERLEEMERSKSWRLTAPLRAASRVLRKLGRKDEVG